MSSSSNPRSYPAHEPAPPLAIQSTMNGPVRSALAPRVRVRLSNGKQEIEPVLDGGRTIEDFRAEFLAAFGGVDETVARALYEQLLNGLHADPRQPLDNSTANLALALLHEVRPREVLEAMLGCQLVIAHIAAMETSRRAIRGLEQHLSHHAAAGGGLRHKSCATRSAPWKHRERVRGRCSDSMSFVSKVSQARMTITPVRAYPGRRERDFS